MSLVPPGLGGSMRLLALGPREWWGVSERVLGPGLRERLASHVACEAMVAVDLSSAVKVLRVEGAAAREILSKSCGLDLDSRTFPAGLCTRTRLANLPVVVDYIDPWPRFDLYVGRSHLTYLKSWLEDAALEFGGPTY
jgi:sarcosine oxidase subunit gamma